MSQPTPNPPQLLRLKLLPSGNLEARLANSTALTDIIQPGERPLKVSGDGDQQISLRKCWRRPKGSWRPSRNGRVMYLTESTAERTMAPVRLVLEPGAIYEGTCKKVQEVREHQRSRPVRVRHQPA